MLSAVGNDGHAVRLPPAGRGEDARPGDGLIGFSTSGNSENLLAAYEKAKQLGVVTFWPAGADGGAMKSSGLVDHLLVVPTDSVHRVEGTAAYHLLWDSDARISATARGHRAWETSSLRLAGGKAKYVDEFRIQPRLRRWSPPSSA